MTHSLPENPSLKQLRNQARELLKAHHAGAPECCATLRLLDEFRDLDDAGILSATVKLTQVQYALAMDYGFDSWPLLVEAVGQTKSGGRAQIGSRLLLEWESQQQMDWRIDFAPVDIRFLRVEERGNDAGEDETVEIRDDGDRLFVKSCTHWTQGGAVLALDGGVSGKASVTIRDPYVSDRRTEREFDLDDLVEGPIEVHVSSDEWPVRNCIFRLRAHVPEVDREAALLASLSEDRQKSIDFLLAAAEETDDPPYRLKLLQRAAAACTGGCNHKPLEPDGWDRAMEIYGRVLEEFPGTDAALNAKWAIASCHGCWSRMSGCDEFGVGKGDWETAILLHQEIHDEASHPGDRAEALRRIGELYCFKTGNLKAGLGSYRKLMDEFPDGPTESPNWTYRTCAPARGIKGIVADAWQAITAKVENASAAVRVLEKEFTGVANVYAAEFSQLLASFAGGDIKANAKAYRSKLYVVVEEVCSWPAAKLRCEAIGGRLAVISNAETNNFIAALIGDPGYSAWIGAQQEGDTWTWVDGSPVDYSNWKSNPTPGAVTLFGNGVWRNADPGDGRWLICEWER